MPIAVVCPGCAAKLNAPDAAAGKKVKCPKPGCGTVLTIPAPAAQFEIVEEDDAPAPKPAPAPVQKKPSKPVVEVGEDDEDDAPKKPAKKARAVEVDEDDSGTPPPKKKAKARAVADEDDEDERPTKKKKKKGGMSPAVIGAIALGGVLVLGGVGYGVYALAFKKSDDSAKKDGLPPAPGTPGGPPGPPPGPGPAPKPGIPAGWREYRTGQDNFKMTMPSDAMVTTRPNGVRKHGGSDSANKLATFVIVREIPPGVNPKDAEATVVTNITSDGVERGRRQVQWLGQAVTEITMEVQEKGDPEVLHIVNRVYATDKLLYMVSIGMDRNGHSQQTTDAIFDTFQFIK